MKRAVVAAAIIALIACTRTPPPPPLAAVVLPDLSRTEKSVQDQINASYQLVQSKKTDANVYGELGKVLFAAEFLEAAETCFLDAQALAPTDARWPYYLGHLYKLRGEAGKSVNAFERALVLQPNDVATLVWLGNEYLENDRADAAQPVFQKALSLQPRSAAAYSGLGRAALARRDYASAVTQLEHALELSPKASAVEYPLGLAYRGLGQIDNAETHLRQRGDKEAVPIDAWMDDLRATLHSAVAYENRGMRALDNGDYAAAVNDFRKGVAFAPDNPSLRHELATALYMSGNTQDAFDEFTEITKRSPEFAKGHYSLGMLLVSQGRLADAVEQFTSAVKADPNYPGAELQLAEALRRSGRAADALPHYSHVIAIDPHAAEARLGYAMALARLKRYGDARQTLIDATQAQPDQPALVQALARLLAAAPDDGVRDGRRAAAIVQTLMKKPHDVDLYEVMAMACAEIGLYDQAVQWQRGAIDGAGRSGRPDLASRMTENLKLFENHMPSRTPWKNDESALAGVK
jgi:tetratricopeptide (TPR) repeat protein